MLSRDDILNINNIVYDAGQAILDIYDTTFEVETKSDNSPLTLADKNSHLVIESGLKSIFPNIPILSEEGRDISYSERKKWDCFWLVDPLDGTKEFINKNGEFTVNIALIENNKPILGVIYAPALSILYFAQKNIGSYKICCSSNLSKLEKSVRLNVNKKKKSDKIKVIGSRSHSNEKFKTWINENFHHYDILQKGSSLKFCEIAEGVADIYPRFGPTSEWDIAAGQIILEEAGGNIICINNEQLSYNSKESLLNPEFIASCKIY